MNRKISVLAAAFAGAIVLAACTSQNQVLFPGPGSTPGQARLYVANLIFIGPTPSAFPGNVNVFNGPFSSSTTVAGTITSGLKQAFGVAVDPTDATGKVFVSDNGNRNIPVYSRPNPNGGAPVFVLTLPTASPLPGLMDFDSSGNLFVPDNNGKIYQFNHPVSSGSSATALALTGLAGSQFCVALDASSNLYVTELSPNTLVAYPPSHSGAPTASTSVGLTNPIGCAVDPLNQDIFVVNETPGGTVNGYAAPLSASASPVVMITWPASNLLTGIGFDSSGNLYVARTASPFAPTTETIMVFNAASLTGTALTPASAAFQFPNGPYEGTQLVFGR